MFCFLILGAQKAADLSKGNMIKIGEVTATVEYSPGEGRSEQVQASGGEGEGITFLEITGIPESISDDYVKLFFENKGGDIADIRYDSKSGRAFIQYVKQKGEAIS